MRRNPLSIEPAAAAATADYIARAAFAKFASQPAS